MPPLGEGEHEGAGAPTGGDGGSEPLSLRETLTQAVEASKGGDGGSDGATPAPKPADAAPARTDGRDASGRFAPKPAEAPAQNAQAPIPAGSDAPRAPASWTPAAKAQFSTLPAEIQAEIARRERDIDQGFAQNQTRLELANRFDALMEPFKARLAAEGTEPIQAVQRLLAAQSYLERDPVQALLFLSRSYGVHPNQLAQATAGQPQASQPQQHPALAPLYQQVQSLQSQLSQRDQVERTQRLQSIQSEIQGFAADPANTYFHNVREDMVALLQSGRAKDLKDAYDKAVWANPETRALLQADAARQAEADRLSAQRGRANEARRAAGSVVGAPTPGSKANGAHSPKSIRESLAEGFKAQRV